MQVPLFNPRQHVWTEHFALDRPKIIGLTPMGRATVKLLDMNSPHRVKLRAELIEDGHFELP